MGLDTAKYFDIDNFDRQWSMAGERQKVIMIRQSATLPPSKGIVPVLAGYLSPRKAVKHQAKITFSTLVKKVVDLLSGNPGMPEQTKGYSESAKFCGRVYTTLASISSEAEREFLFKQLVIMGGAGPGTVFMAVVQGLVSPEEFLKTARRIPESGRLELTYHYIKSSPEIRRKLGRVFTSLLTSVKSRSQVIKFYAGLFDRGQDADPFLHNINPALRSPKSIIKKELASKNTGTRITGLKALSMMLNRVPTKQLLPFLSANEPARLRATIYQIIENATPGVYKDLFPPIFRLLERARGKEALHGVKALVVTGKEPLYKLIDRIAAFHPFLIPAIEKEVSSLSKTGFLFIQDIALNPDRYRDGIHHAINQACIFGMIKKRPERVAALVQKSIKNRETTSFPELIHFVKQVKQMLEKEKKDIASPFLAVMNRPDIKRERMAQRDYSDKQLDGSTLNFKETEIKSCNFSGATLSFSAFNRAVISDCRMKNTLFEGVSFDHSIWINVNASGAVFKNCSFESARIFNSNFSHASIMGSFFIDAVIAGTGFDHGELTFSSFAHSRLSGVSLSRTRVSQVDFSGVKARFSRFPPRETGAAQAEGIDYNARKFQPHLSDIPHLGNALTRDINILIFCEFTHYGEAKFLKQNKRSLITALDIFKDNQADLFSMIPVLIHENLDFPLLPPIPEQTPRGIFDFHPSLEAIDLCSGYMGAPPPSGMNQSPPAVLGLFTIGSVGSIAQTTKSDIDYWVCIRETALKPYERKLLEKKLSLLEKMARDHFKTPVTFFIVDITRVRENDFGDSTMESSGSAQAGLLKEEFYRTMIHLAGKIPLWSVLPTAICRRYYPPISQRVCASPSQDRYLDLGDIHNICPEEYFGASIWQMFKWIKSPFKSILKMALLEKYLFEPKTKGLLCNQYKNEWMNTGAYLKLAQNDAYYFLMKHLVGFYEEARDTKSVNLLLTCFFLKLGISGQAQLENTPFGIRKILLLKCLEVWNWDLKKVFEVGNVNAWPYKNIVRLSNTLEAYILEKYREVKKDFDNTQTTLISVEDRTILEHKIKIEFSDQPMKVRKILLVSRGDRHFSRLYLKCISEALPSGKWVLLNQPALRDLKDEPIFTAQTIEEIGAWMVVNGLYSSDTRIHLLSSPFPVTETQVNTLFKNIHLFFNTMITKPVAFEQLLVYPEKKALFVSMNFYTHNSKKTITHYTALYANAWNEVFCQSGYSGQGFISMAHIKRDLKFKLRTRKLPDKTAYYLSKTPEQ